MKILAKLGVTLAGGALLATPAAIAGATTPHGHIVPTRENRLHICRDGNPPEQCPDITNSGNSRRAIVAYPKFRKGKVYGLGVHLPRGNTTDALYYEKLGDDGGYWFFEYQGVYVPGMRKNERVKLYYRDPVKRRMVTRCKPLGDREVKLPSPPYAVNGFGTVIVRVTTKCRNRG